MHNPAYEHCHMPIQEKGDNRTQHSSRRWSCVDQNCGVNPGAKTTWRTLWKTFMQVWPAIELGHTSASQASTWFVLRHPNTTSAVTEAAFEIALQELAPQSKDGEYTRPSYDLRGRIGSPEFPVSVASFDHLLIQLTFGTLSRLWQVC